ncbi:mRNA decay activator protein ZFP36L2-B-like isoform X2 [Hydractinia symbiolongicarpus]|uniref:mRNA decay activator protein ZFP36L2-B-like isoform X2 n=1 Tax=Hydractinia symbiolongicarpus TaxID=13093 RepID=UPI00254E8373|nr:mRNA decay activator protein ZFP36L2-B-like isoform X2 [Hydractinia symbiolongicarpus]
MSIAIIKVLTIERKMSTALVSAFYDINDVIQQSKQRPTMLDLRQRLLDRKPNNLLIPRRHSTNSSTLTASPLTKPTLSPTSSSFYPMPPSPKDQFLGGTASPLSIRERAQSASFQEELEAQHRKRSATNSSRYKTELCRPFEENGTCKYGDKCQFAHGFHELRGLNRHPKYKTEFCRTYHTIGFCPYGPRCHFIHNDEEKRPPSTTSPHTISVSSVESADIAPSPFSNLTPPISPGYGGEVFLFDETSHAPNTPLGICGQNIALDSMNTIQENPFPSPSSSMDYNMMKQSSLRGDSDPCPTQLISDSIREMSFQPIQTKFDERILTPSESGSSNPPSPTDSCDGSRRRLPVFGFQH